MLNGLKDFMRRDKPANENDRRKSKKGMIVLCVLAGAVILNMIIRFASGDAQYRDESIAYIRDNFHISPIDLGIMTTMLIILIIIKIKKNKK